MSSFDMRPRSVGEVLDGAIKLYLANARTLIGIVACVVVPLQILSAIVLLSVVPKGSEIPGNLFAFHVTTFHRQGYGQTQASAGADFVSFGGTKNGLMLGEAVIVADPALADDVRYLRKQTLQLASKMRFLSAQFEAYLTDDLWRRGAAHANAMAARLAAGLRGLESVQVTQPVQANVVFARLPRSAIARLQDRYPFHVWDEARDEVRWMCSWDTSEQDVDGFAAAIRETLGAWRLTLDA
jgi:hypothetical protein